MKKFLPFAVFMFVCLHFSLQADEPSPSHFDSYTGRVMTGYQGWFNTPSDGAGQGWRHYSQQNRFEPGTCTIDFWPDMTEYEKKYETPFAFADGSTATLFSSYDASTVDLHFRWMKEYDIDGAFMQRFIHDLHRVSIQDHYNTVFSHAYVAAEKYQRAISIRYDLTDMDADGPQTLFEDLDALNETYRFFDRTASPTFLYHNQKPLIAIGGVGFAADTAGLDDVGYLRSAEVIIAGLRERGYSIMMRVPAKWREFGGTTVVRGDDNRERLHQIIQSVDIVMPWHVGAYSEETYHESKWRKTIEDDIEWCEDNDIEYVPVLWPGFSRTNLRNGDTSSFRPRNEGSFLWLQLWGAIRADADKLFLAQFDEMDEGTQFFKCVAEPPEGKSPFVGYEPTVRSDHYLWLAQQISGVLKKEIRLKKTPPERSD